MLTRLKVNGFKNLLGLDVAFGPFTCIAGPNGVGKSNLFDAITFLGALADKPLMDAARCVRDEKNRTTDVGTLFHESGARRAQEMSFEAEMLVPLLGNDDLGQRAEAAITFLKYRLVLALRTEEEFRHGERLEIKEESLTHVNVSDAHRYLGFPHRPVWRQSVVRGARRGGPFLSTEHNGDRRIIKLHQDGGRGRPRAGSEISSSCASCPFGCRKRGFFSMSGPFAPLQEILMERWN